MVGDDIRDDVIGAQDAGFQVNRHIHFLTIRNELLYQQISFLRHTFHISGMFSPDRKI